MRLNAAPCFQKLRAKPIPCCRRPSAEAARGLGAAATRESVPRQGAAVAAAATLAAANADAGADTHAKPARARLELFPGPATTAAFTFSAGTIRLKFFGFGYRISLMPD